MESKKGLSFTPTSYFRCNIVERMILLLLHAMLSLNHTPLLALARSTIFRRVLYHNCLLSVVSNIKSTFPPRLKLMVIHFPVKSWSNCSLGTLFGNPARKETTSAKLASLWRLSLLFLKVDKCMVWLVKSTHTNLGSNLSLLVNFWSKLTPWKTGEFTSIVLTKDSSRDGWVEERLTNSPSLTSSPSLQHQLQSPIADTYEIYNSIVRVISRTLFLQWILFTRRGLIPQQSDVWRILTEMLMNEANCWRLASEWMNTGRYDSRWREYDTLGKYYILLFYFILICMSSQHSSE